MSDIQNRLGGVDHKDVRDVLATVLDQYGDRIGLAMSFQVGGVVLLDMISRMGKTVEVFSIDTGRLPEETYECANRVSTEYGIHIRWVFPKHGDVERILREKGLYSFKGSVENRKECGLHIPFKDGSGI